MRFSTEVQIFFTFFSSRKRSLKPQGSKKIKASLPSIIPSGKLGAEPTNIIVLGLIALLTNLILTFLLIGSTGIWWIFILKYFEALSNAAWAEIGMILFFFWLMIRDEEERNSKGLVRVRFKRITNFSRRSETLVFELRLWSRYYSLLQSEDQIAE